MYGAYKTYKLSPDEIELARMDRFKDIPAAEHREHEVVDPRAEKQEETSTGRRVRKWDHITKTEWLEEVAKGKSHSQVAEYFGVPIGTVPIIMQRFGLSGRAHEPKKKQRRRSDGNKT